MFTVVLCGQWDQEAPECSKTAPKMLDGVSVLFLLPRNALNGVQLFIASFKDAEISRMGVSYRLTIWQGREGLADMALSDLHLLVFKPL